MMTMLRHAIPLLVLLAVGAGLTVSGVARAAQDEEPPAVAKVGRLAPHFTLKTAKGETHALEKYRGKIVVIEWTDPNCKYVQGLYTGRRVMPKTEEAVKKLDKNVVWLSIESGRVVTPEQHQVWIERNKITHPILLDPDLKIKERYRARFAPHMVVIDAKGVLRYQGAIDDDPVGAKRPEQTKNYVINAVTQILADAPVSPSSTKAYGCLLKRRQ